MAASNRTKGNRTIAETSACGDVSIRLAVILVLGIFIMTLTVGSLWFSFQNPDKIKDIWFITGPLLTAVVTVMGYVFSHGKRK